MYKLHLEGEGHGGQSELAYKIPHNDNDDITYYILYGRVLSSARAK
jgi:hypothetical protein